MIPQSVAATLIGLIPDLIHVISEAFQHDDPKRALRIGAAAMAAERSGHAAVDAMIDRNKK
jgi:hypothetical protein